MKIGRVHIRGKRPGFRGRLLLDRELPKGSLRRLHQAVKKQSKRYRKELKRCQEESSEKAVHALRIGSRRLLSTIELLEGFLPPRRVKEIQHALKSNLDIFDALRDTQVQLLAIGKMRRNFPAARNFYTCLLDRQHRAILQTRKDIRRVKAGHLRKLIADARKEVKRHGKDCLASTVSKLLLAAVDRAFAKTNHLRNRIDPRRPGTIHRTRVAFKRFRYMFETLARHTPRLRRDLIPEMQHYQTMMGEIQDANMLLAALDKFLRENEVSSKAAEHLREELLRRRQWLIGVYLDRAHHLKEFWE
jgi:CHAD domain-containing protein